MFSYILLFLSALPFLAKENNLKIDRKIYSLLLTSGLFSYSILGFISLILIHLNSSKFPIKIISILIFLFTFFLEKNTLILFSTIKKFLLEEFLKFKNNFCLLNEKKSAILILVLVVLITLSSIGPINHPDSLDYHVGYPYQYWLRGKFFIDGGLHQALMGIGDYANLAFIQEKTMWLIRYIQIFNLPVLSLFLINKIKNKIYIIAFFTSSTFIQWGTIGKPLFLGESTCAISYILWKEYKDSFSRRLLLVCIVSCISIKISSLIVCTPILLDIIFDIFLNKENNLKNKITNLKVIIADRSLLVSITLLIILLFTRYKIIQNFAYPLLTNIFNKNDIVIKNFTKFLTGYQRDGLFPINIFLPISLSDIASSLGPAIFFIFLLLIIRTFTKPFQKSNSLFYVCLAQAILLITFCQGRADYYAIPVIISIYNADNLNLFFRNKFIKISFYSLISIQLILIIGFLFFAINLNLFSIIDYEKTMTSTAYGFDFSKLIKQKSSGNFYQNVIRDAKLFFPENYITRERMQRCFENNSQNYCFKKYNITQIISSPKFLLNKNGFSCDIREFVSASRNPVNRKKVEVEICEQLTLSK